MHHRQQDKIKVGIAKTINIADIPSCVKDFNSFYSDSKTLYIAIRDAVNSAGGFPDKIVNAKKILIKPNLLTVAKPEKAVTTHPEVVRQLIRLLREGNEKDIYIGDSPAGQHAHVKLWETTGFLKLCKEENVELFPFENIKRIKIPEIGTVPVLDELDKFDAVISVPKLKTHSLTKITGAVKNSYGLVVGGAKSHFHARFPSPKQMAECISKIYPYVKPDFVLMDAIVCMEGDGPSMGKPAVGGLILASADPVAVDICACKIYGYSYKNIPHLKMLTEKELKNPEDMILCAGTGLEQINNLCFKRSKADLLHKIPQTFFKLVTWITSCRPFINRDICKQCGICAQVCPKQAIVLKKNGYNVNRKKCILCMCCIEACPYHAIQLLSPGLRIIKKLKNFFKREKSHSYSKSFTLIELVAVIAIFTIVSLIVLPRIGKIPAFVTLDNCVNKIKGIFIEASHQALARGTMVKVIFDAPKHKIYIDSPKKQGGKEITDKKTFNEFFSYTLPEKFLIRFSPSESVREKAVFYFYGDGSADGPDIRITIKGHSAILGISPLTGMVFVRYPTEDTE